MVKNLITPSIWHWLRSCAVILVCVGVGMPPRSIAADTAPSIQMRFLGLHPMAYASEVAVSGTRVAVTGNIWVDGKAQPALQILDVQDPTQPILLSQITDKHQGFGDVAWSGDTLAVIIVHIDLPVPRPPDLVVFDVRQPTQPREVTRRAFEADGWDVTVQAVGSLLYVKHWRDGATVLDILDIRDPPGLSILGTYQAPDFGLLDVQVVGTTAYIIGQLPPMQGYVPTQLRIVDLHNPAAPAEQGAITITSLDWGRYPQGGEGLVAYRKRNEDGASAVPFVDSRNPHDLKEYVMIRNEAAWDVTVHMERFVRLGTILICPVYREGESPGAWIEIFQIDPGAARVIRTSALPLPGVGTSEDTVAVGNRFYLATSTGLAILALDWPHRVTFPIIG